MSSYYWSSTTNANNTNNAWNVNFNNGNDNNNNKNNNNYVRAVRGGKCSLLSFRSIYDAYLDCRRRKRGTINALRFEADLLANLFDLALDLQKGRYRPSRSVCFVTRSPKLREIFAADFRDRIVHHLVVRELEKIWDPRFIHDSYASRKGKGIHSAVERLQGFMRKVSRNGKRAGYFLQLDVRSFFMSIDKRVLFSLFDRDPKASEVLRALLSVLIFHDPTTDYHFRGDRKLLNAIPPHKTLFKVGPDKGLPIGNLTSQFFANVYLNELDQFVKHELRCRFYLRYVDDFILLGERESVLSDWREQISRFLHERLALRLKAGDRVRRVSEGANFLGYITRPGYRLVRKRVVNNLKYVLARTRDKLITETPVNMAHKGIGCSGSRRDAALTERATLPALVRAASRRDKEVHEAGTLKVLGRSVFLSRQDAAHTRGTELESSVRAASPPRPLDPKRQSVFSVRTLTAQPGAVMHLRQVLASYLGHFKHADSHHLVQSIFKKNPWLRQLFGFYKGKLVMKAVPVEGFLSMRAQVWFFRRHFPGFILMFKVGRYVELYGRDALLLKGNANLKLREYQRGLRHGVGFPLRMTTGMRRNLLLKGYKTALFAEDEIGGRVKKRYVSELAVMMDVRRKPYLEERRPALRPWDEAQKLKKRGGLL